MLCRIRVHAGLSKWTRHGQKQHEPGTDDDGPTTATSNDESDAPGPSVQHDGATTDAEESNERNADA